MPWEFPEYPGNWKDLKSWILRRDTYTCQNCGAQGVELHIHHIIPLSKGGSNDPGNLITLCRECHEAVHPHMRTARLAREGRKVRRKWVKPAEWQRPSRPTEPVVAFVLFWLSILAGLISLVVAMFQAILGNPETAGSTASGGLGFLFWAAIFFAYTVHKYVKIEKFDTKSYRQVGFQTSYNNYSTQGNQQPRRKQRGMNGSKSSIPYRGKPRGMHPQRIQIGAQVTIKDQGRELVETVKVVSPEKANLAKGWISSESPVGKHLIGKCTGEEIVVDAPSGRITYTIVRIE